MSLKKLQDIDAKDIPDLIKSIDFNVIIHILKTQPEILIKTIAIIATTIFVIYTIPSKSLEKKQLKAKGITLQKVLEAKNEQDKLQKKLLSLRNKFPKSLPSNEIITYLSQTAEKRNLQVESVSPAQKSKKDLYEELTMNITISSNEINHEYKNIALFINDIENSNYALKLDELTCTLQKTKSRQSRGTSLENDSIRVDVKITSVYLN